MSSFLPLFFRQKIQTQTVSREKLRITISYEKARRKNVNEIDNSLGIVSKLILDLITKKI